MLAAVSSSFSGTAAGTGQEPSYYDVHSDAATLITVTKAFAAAETLLVVDFRIEHRRDGDSITGGKVRYAVRVDDSTDHDSWGFRLDGDVDADSRSVSGFFQVTGIAAGSRTLELRYRGEDGGIVEWMDLAGWGMVVWEVPVSVVT